MLGDVVHVIIGEAQHLDNGPEEQDVAVVFQPHLLIHIVLHWEDVGSVHTQQSAQQLGLCEEEEDSHLVLKNRHRSASRCWSSSHLTFS